MLGLDMVFLIRSRIAGLFLTIALLVALAATAFGHRMFESTAQQQIRAAAAAFGIDGTAICGKDDLPAARDGGACDACRLIGSVDLPAPVAMPRQAGLVVARVALPGGAMAPAAAVGDPARPVRAPPLARA